MKFPRLVLPSSCWPGLAAPARAANKDMERLCRSRSPPCRARSPTCSGLEESLKEIRRLNEVLAEQNANLQKGVQDQRVQERGAAGRGARADGADLGAEERMDGMRRAGGARRSTRPAAPPPPGAAPAAPAGAAARRPPRRRRLPPAHAPPPRELYSQAYADYARGNYDLAIQEYREYLRLYPEHRLLRQRAVLDRRVPILEAALRRGGRGMGRAVPGLPLQRQAARRAAQEGHGPGAAGPAPRRAGRVPVRGRALSRTPRPDERPGSGCRPDRPPDRAGSGRANIPTPQRARQATASTKRKATWPA